MNLVVRLLPGFFLISVAISFSAHSRDPETISLPEWKNSLAMANVLDEREVDELFSTIAKRSEIPFEFLEDGCYARANYMSYLMEKAGIKNVKIYVEGKLWVATRNSPQCYVEMWFHVAPMVLMKRKSGKIQQMVIDPSLFDRAVNRDVWINKLTSHTPQAPYSYVHTAYYGGSAPSSLVHSEESTKLSREDLKKTLGMMRYHMSIVRERREQKRIGIFPECFDIDSRVREIRQDIEEVSMQIQYLKDGYELLKLYKELH